MTTYRIFRRAQRWDVQVITSSGRNLAWHEFCTARQVAAWLSSRDGVIEFTP